MKWSTLVEKLSDEDMKWMKKHHIILKLRNMSLGGFDDYELTLVHDEKGHPYFAEQLDESDDNSADIYEDDDEF